MSADRDNLARRSLLGSMRGCYRLGTRADILEFCSDGSTR
jgi:hypothetical protein